MHTYSGNYKHITISDVKNEKIAEISDSFIYPGQKLHEDINWTVKGKAKNEEKALNKIKEHIYSSRKIWISKRTENWDYWRYCT